MLDVESSLDPFDIEPFLKESIANSIKPWTINETFSLASGTFINHQSQIQLSHGL